MRRLLWLAGFGALWLNVLDDPPLSTGGYLQDVTPTGATVAMVTGSPTQLVCTVRNAAGAEVRSVLGPAGRRRHVLRVTGLDPATDYMYSIEEVAGGVADHGHFRTAPTEGDDRTPTRFAFLGDSGAQPWWVWLQRTPALHLPARWRWFGCASAVTAIGAAVASYQPDFVLHLGDVIYPKGLHAHYSSGLFRPFAEVMRHAPLYAVLGNHDVMDCDGLQFLANLRLPPSEATGDGRFLSFARGPVRIIGFDCNTDRVGATYDGSHPAAVFMAGELAKCTEPWIVVASHYPMRTQSRMTYDRADLLLHLLPVMEQHAVSLYLSGHDHCYQRFGTPGDGGVVPLVVSGGGGKDLYEVRPNPRAAKLASVHHWCSAETVGDELVVCAHGLDGSVVDTFTVGLPEGVALDVVRANNPARASRIDGLRQH